MVFCRILRTDFVSAVQLPIPSSQCRARAAVVLGRPGALELVKIKPGTLLMGNPGAAASPFRSTPAGNLKVPRALHRSCRRRSLSSGFQPPLLALSHRYLR
jgi:hypothetical protein